MNYFINGKYKNQRVTGVQRVAVEYEKRLGYPVISPPVWIRHPFLLILWEQLVLPFLLPKNSNLLSLCNTGPIVVRRQVLFLHDIAFVRYSSSFSRSFVLVYKALIPVLVRRCIHVVTCSQFSKNEIVDFYKSPPSKVSVIPNGVDRSFFSIKDNLGYTCKGVQVEKYLLTVGSLDPRKNIDRMVTLWVTQGLYQKYNYRLKVVGGACNNFKSSIIEFDEDNGVDFLGYISDEELVCLYEGATMFIYPSQYEGFGLPPLEAMAMGVPCMVSNTPALVEVAGGAAFIFELEEFEASFVECLDNAMKSSSLRSEMSVRGLDRASQYDWSISFKKMETLLCNLRSKKLGCEV